MNNFWSYSIFWYHCTICLNYSVKISAADYITQCVTNDNSSCSIWPFKVLVRPFGWINPVLESRGLRVKCSLAEIMVFVLVSGLQLPGLVDHGLVFWGCWGDAVSLGYPSFSHSGASMKNLWIWWPMGSNSGFRRLASMAGLYSIDRHN